MFQFDTNGFGDAAARSEAPCRSARANESSRFARSYRPEHFPTAARPSPWRYAPRPRLRFKLISRASIHSPMAGRGGPCSALMSSPPRRPGRRHSRQQARQLEITFRSRTTCRRATRALAGNLRFGAADEPNHCVGGFGGGEQCSGSLGGGHFRAGRHAGKSEKFTEEKCLTILIS